MHTGILKKIEGFPSFEVANYRLNLLVIISIIPMDG